MCVYYVANGKNQRVMGADGVLVSFPVFKTVCLAWIVRAEFDSQTLPPPFLIIVELLSHFYYSLLSHLFSSLQDAFYMEILA